MALSKPKRRLPHPNEVRMTLGEHLEELRFRLIRIIIAAVAGMIVCFAFRNYLIAFLAWPVFPVLDRYDLPRELYTLDPVEAFLTNLKVSLIIGLIITCPYGLYQIWMFVAAGLYPHERGFVGRFVPFSVALFLAGALFLLLIVMPVLLNFLIGFMQEVPAFDAVSGMFPDWLTQPTRSVEPLTAAPATQAVTGAEIPVLDAPPPPGDSPVTWIDAETREVRWRIGEKIYTSELREVARRNIIRPNFTLARYLNFTLALMAAFGIGFQVPVVVTFLVTIGVTTVDQLRSSRRYVWFVMACLAALFTPPDVASMLLLMVPMALLFELGLFISKGIERRREREEKSEAEREE